MHKPKEDKFCKRKIDFFSQPKGKKKKHKTEKCKYFYASETFLLPIAKLDHL